MKTLRIRDASVSDVSLITAIVRESFKDVAFRYGLTAGNCPKHPSNCREGWINHALNKGVHFFILEVNDQPCGCIALEPATSRVGYIERLGVLPTHRRNGYGRAMVEHALTQAANLGLRRIDIGIISEQSELGRWYEHFGFIETKRAVFDHLPFEVMFMSKAID